MCLYREQPAREIIRLLDEPLFYFKINRLYWFVLSRFWLNDYRLDTYYHKQADFLVKVKYGRYRPAMIQSIWKIQNRFSKDAALISGKVIFFQRELRNLDFVLDSYPNWLFRCDQRLIDFVVSVWLCDKKKKNLYRLRRGEKRYNLFKYSRMSYLRARFDCELLNMRINHLIVDVTLGPRKLQVILHIAQFLAIE